MIAQKYKEFINHLIEQVKQEYLMNLNHPNVKYIDLIESFSKSFFDIQRRAIASYLEKMDLEFRNSPGRTLHYHVKKNEYRNLATRFGSIRFKRTVYISTYTGKCYIHVDRELGLVKYDLYDPDVKGMILESAAEHGEAKAGRIITSIINKCFKGVNISRQLVRTIVNTSKLSEPKVNNKLVTDTLYVMADELFVSTQRDDKDLFVKHVVVFDGYKRKGKRLMLTNKHGITTVGRGLSTKVLNYIVDSYDIEKISKVYVMGDGAGWIKSLREHLIFNRSTTIYALDKFHFKQALRHITVDDDLREIVKSYILNDRINDFNFVVDYLIELYPHREEVLSIKRNYMLNNLAAIKNMYNYRLSCCMESQISHNLAEIYTSRPKGFSRKHFAKRLRLRMLFKNKHNIKELYLNNLHTKKIIDMNQVRLNHSLFDHSVKETVSFTNNKHASIKLKYLTH